MECYALPEPMASQTKQSVLPGTWRGHAAEEEVASDTSGLVARTALQRTSLTFKKEHVDLGDGSDLLFYPKFCHASEADDWLKALDKQMPWSRPSLFVYGRFCTQPRESCYVAGRNLPALKYSGHEPVVYHWDDFPVLQCILQAVQRALPEATFNSVLLNRYANGSDYAAWHSDNESIYGPSPIIASVSLGTEREFLVRMKKGYRMDKESQTSVASDSRRACKVRRLNIESSVKAGSKELPGIKGANIKDHYSFFLKHGSLLVMRGNMQRDWDHSIPKRLKVAGLRINLTFRKVNP